MILDNKKDMYSVSVPLLFMRVYFYFCDFWREQCHI